MLRTFVAIELPEPVRAALMQTIAKAKPNAPGKLTWSARENLHLTLVFLGATEESKLALLGQRLREVAEQNVQFELELAAPGVFPKSLEPTALWIGLKPSTSLARLQSQIAEASRALGWELETRPYAAHLTCARVKSAGVPGALAEHWSAATVSPMHFQATQVSLMRSDTRPEGAIYSALERFPLSAQ